MEVILIEEVSHLGHAGELVKVKTGYARNYLLPKRLAVKKSPYSLKILEKQREELEQKRALKKAGYEKLKEAIEKIGELKILVKASKEGKTYGAVTALMIEKQLKTLYNLAVDKSKIVIRKPIKVVGDYELSIIFNKALSTKLKVVVVPLEE